MQPTKQQLETAAEAVEQAAEGAATAEAAAEEAAAVAVVAAELAASEAADQGRVYDDQQAEDARIAAVNAGLAQLDARMLRVEAILRRQGFAL